MQFTQKIQEFKEKIKYLYTDKYIYLNIIKSIENPPLKTFRVTKGFDVNHVLGSLENQGFKLKKVFADDIFFAVVESKIGKELSKTPEFDNHKIYIQQASSSLPIKILNLDNTKKFKILDLCASPGSKTTQLSDLINSESEIWAIEKNFKRYLKLKKVLSKYSSNANTLNIDANILYRQKPYFLNYFDVVIADVPCSNEGNIVISRSSTLKYWSLKEPPMISKLQKGLINSAFKFLKPKGLLIYSTCTFSVEENEEVVNWFLEKNKNAKLMDFDLPISNYINGFTFYKSKTFHKDLLKTKRVLPDGLFTAFFIAKIIKTH